MLVADECGGNFLPRTRLLRIGSIDDTNGFTGAMSDFSEERVRQDTDMDVGELRGRYGRMLFSLLFFLS